MGFFLPFVFKNTMIELKVKKKIVVKVFKVFLLSLSFFPLPLPGINFPVLLG